MTASLTLSLALSLSASPSQQEPIQTLVVSGANNHDWEWTTPRICAALEETGRFVVQVTTDPKEDLKHVGARHAAGDLDLILLDYNGPRWGDEAESSFLDAVRAGCGVTVVHAANNAFSGWQDYERLVGLLWRRGTGHGRYHAFDVHVVDHNHPVTRGMKNFFTTDMFPGSVGLSEGQDARLLCKAFLGEDRRRRRQRRQRRNGDL